MYQWMAATTTWKLQGRYIYVHARPIWHVLCINGCNNNVENAWKENWLFRALESFPPSFSFIFLLSLILGHCPLFLLFSILLLSESFFTSSFPPTTLIHTPTSLILTTPLEPQLQELGFTHIH